MTITISHSHGKKWTLQRTVSLDHAEHETYRAENPFRSAVNERGVAFGEGVPKLTVKCKRVEGGIGEVDVFMKSRPESNPCWIVYRENGERVSIGRNKKIHIFVA